jgi:protein-disulfide isomerase
VPKTTVRSVRSRALCVSPRSRLFALALAAVPLSACAAQEDTGDEVLAAHRPSFAGIPQHGDELGVPSAKLTLEEFADLRCSHCRAFVDITLPILLDRYVRAGTLRIVFHNLPILGQASVDAARMAAAVGLQGHEFEFVDAFFHRPPGVVSDDVLGAVAAQIPGVDVAAALAARSSSAVYDDLAADRSLAIRYGIAGTPTFLLGKTGSDPQALQAARSNLPETLTGPIDALLAQP